MALFDAHAFTFAWNSNLTQSTTLAIEEVGPGSPRESQPRNGLTCENVTKRNSPRKYFLRFLWPLVAPIASRGANTETPALFASLQPGAFVSPPMAIRFGRQFTRADLSQYALGS